MTVRHTCRIINLEMYLTRNVSYQEKRISGRLSRLCLTITMAVYGYLGTMAETALK